MLKQLWTGAAYGRAVYHATCDTCAGRKVIAILTKGVVDGAHVGKFVTAFGSGGPALDQLEDLCFNVVIDAGRGLEDGYQVVHKLTRGHLCKEVGTAILDARVCQAEGAELRVWVFMADTLPEGAHGILWWYGLGTYQVGNLQVEGNVLEAAAGSFLDLQVQLGAGSGGPPSHHVGKKSGYSTGYSLLNQEM